MSIFTVDRKQCSRCGICAAVCPNGMIRFEDQGSFPEPDNQSDKICINCGHCVAVCPQAALSLEKMPVGQCPPVQEQLSLSPQKLEHYLRARRSIRAFKEEAVDRDLLSKIIDIARFAPSSRNCQPVHWVVVYDREKLQQMTRMVINSLRYLMKKDPMMPQVDLMSRLVADYESGVDSICRRAPHIIITHSYQNENQAVTDCTIAMTYLELALPAFGLGGCWAGYFNSAAAFWPPLQNALGIPKDHLCFGSMLVGYPEYKYHRLPLREDADVAWC